MLEFYESFQKCDIPTSLKGELFDGVGNPLNYLEELNKINILVGANNSGKSKLLREILRTQRDKYYSNNRKTEILNFLELINSKIKRLSHNLGGNRPYLNNDGKDVFNFEHFEQLITPFLTIAANYDINQLILTLKTAFSKDFKEFPPDNIRAQGSGHGNKPLDAQLSHNILQELANLKNIVTEKTSWLSEQQHSTFDTHKCIYIPSVRTLRPFARRSKISDETKREYGFGETINIYNGELMATDIQQLKNSNTGDRRKIKAFEKFLSEEFFDKKEIELTVPIGTDLINIKIGEEKEQPIHNLGDGLQMIIIITFPFFIYDCGFIGIEEPELFIHPGLQKELLKFFLHHPKTNNFQIFLSSHSNHILDAVNYTNKLSIFTVRKAYHKKTNDIEILPDFVVENVAYGNDNLLNLLGVTNTSVYLSNCTIWVEGITDRLYLQRIISQYVVSAHLKEEFKLYKHLQEGVNYSFALTAGDSIVHWDFSEDSSYEADRESIIVKKFCGKSLVIVDNDFGKNLGRKSRLKDLLAERFIELPVPETENLLSIITIKKTIIQYSTVAKAFPEISNLPEVDVEMLKHKKIGLLIDELLIKDEPGVKRFNKTGSGSLSPTDKLEFCRKSLEFIEAGNLTTDAISLAEIVLAFIIGQNKNAILP